MSILFFLAEYFATFCGMSEVSEAGGLRALRCSENRLRAFGPGDFLRTSAPSALQLRSLRSFRKNVAKYSAKKNKILTKNEFTHPTETPLCLWYAVFVPNNLRFLNEKLILWNGKLNNGKINYFSLLNRNFLYRNVFSWLTLLSLGNYPTIEILCESWFRCIRNHWNMASITGGIQFQSQSSVFFNIFTDIVG